MFEILRNTMAIIGTAFTSAAILLLIGQIIGVVRIDSKAAIKIEKDNEKH